MPESRDDYLLLENQVCFPLYAASNLLQRLYRPLLAPLGLTYSQYLVMLLLWEHERLTVGEIGACLHLDNGTLTPLLKRMERDDFITRRRDPQDERRVLIELTVHGGELRAQALTVPGTLAQEISLPLGDVESLRRSAATLVKLLAKVDRPRGNIGGPTKNHANQ